MVLDRRRVWREEVCGFPNAAARAGGSGTLRFGRAVCEPSAPDHLGVFDFQFDQTAAEHILKLLHVVDEFTRETLAIRCARRIDSDATVAVLELLAASRGRAREFGRCDDGHSADSDTPNVQHDNTHRLSQRW